jgi:hypothetical protein
MSSNQKKNSSLNNFDINQDPAQRDLLEEEQEEGGHMDNH